MAENPIDSLSIKIDGDVSGAEKQIESIKATLNELKGIYESASSFSGDIGSKLSDLAKGVNAIAGIDANALKASTAAIRGLAKVDLTSIVTNFGNAGMSVSENMESLAQAMSALASIPSDASGMIKTVKSIASLDIQGFVNNVMLIPGTLDDKLSTLSYALNTFAGTVDASGVKSVAKAVKELASIDFGKLSQNIGSLDDSAIEKIRRFMEGLSLLGNNFNPMDTIQAFTNLTQIDFTGFNDFADNAPQRFTKLSQSLIDFASTANSPEIASAIQMLERLNNIDLAGLSSLGNIQVTVPDVTGAINAETQSATGAAQSLRDRVLAFFDFKAGMGDIVHNTFGVFTGAMKTAYKGVTAYVGAVKTAFGALGNAASKLGNKLMAIPRSFMRIAKYRFIRTIIKQITHGFKEGTDNLYQYSKMINGQFAKSMDMLATSQLYFRNSIGAAAAPIINQLAPAIDLLVDKIVNLLNKFNELSARLSGQSTWTKALKYPKEYAAATADANKEIKDAQKAVKDFQMGFDELNVISDNNNDLASSLTNADADAIDYSKMFQEMQTTGGFIKSLDELFDSIPWDEYGRKVGAGINLVVDKIREVLEGNDFHKLGKGFADFFNGMFDEIKWVNIGIALADGLNTILAIWNGFVSNFKFAEFGTDLSQFFNGFVDTINFDELAVNIQKSLDGLLDTIINFFKGANFKQLGQKIGSAINLFDLPTLLGKAATTLSEFVKSSFDLLNGFFEATDWQKLGNDIFEGIKAFLYNADWSGVAAKCAELLGNAFNAVTGILGGIGANIVMDLPDDWLSDWETGAEDFMKYTQWIRDAISGLGFDLENGTYSFENFVDNWTTGVDEIANIKDRWVEYWTGIGESVYDALHKADGSIADHKNEIDSWVDEEPATLERLIGFLKGWGNDWVQTFEKAGESVYDFKEGLKTKFDDAVKKTADFSTKFVNKIETMKTNVKNKFTNMKNSVVSVFTGIKTGIEDVLNKLYDKIAEWKGFDKFVTYVAGIPETIKGHVDDIKTNIVEALASLPNAIKGIVNTSLGYVENLINDIIDGFGEITGVFNKAFKWASKILGDDAFSTEVTKSTHITLPRYDQGGFPNSASLFMANENGVAEMVGQIGNRTAVANNDQIVNAVSDGVSVAVSYVMAEYIPQIISAIMQGKTIEIDGKALARTVNEANRTIGATVYSGGVV